MILIHPHFQLAADNDYVIEGIFCPSLRHLDKATINGNKYGIEFPANFKLRLP